jgi:hypothetical protein
VLCDKLGALGDLFRSVDSPNWNRFEGECLAVHGDQAKPVLDAVFTGSQLGSLKHARTIDPVLASWINTSTAPHVLVKAAIDAMAAAVDAGAREIGYRDRYDEAMTTVKAAGLSMMSPELDQLQKSITSPVSVEGPKPSEFQLNPDVGLESSLSKAQLQVALRDMMTDDDVISAHAAEDPQSIIQAVETLAKTSPQILKNPGLLQTVLRRHLELGTTEPHEHKQIQDITTGGQK